MSNITHSLLGFQIEFHIFLFFRNINYSCIRFRGATSRTSAHFLFSLGNNCQAFLQFFSTI